MNCCGGSFSTLGNMKRAVPPTMQPTNDAVKAPHASPIQPRRPISGELSSAAGAALRGAPRAAAVVVRPASAGLGAGGAAAFGFGFAGGTAPAGGGFTGPSVSAIVAPCSVSPVATGNARPGQRIACAASPTCRGSDASASSVSSAALRTRRLASFSLSARI